MYSVVLTLFAFLSPATFFILYRHFKGRYDKEARIMGLLFLFTTVGNLLALIFLVYPGNMYWGAGAIAGVSLISALVTGLLTLTR